MATLIMVAKYPQPGRCKTRLAAGLGTDGAAAFARAALCDLLERFAGEAALGRRVLLFAPRDEREVRAGGAGARAEPCACARHAARILPPLHAGLGVLGAACALRLVLARSRRCLPQGFAALLQELGTDVEGAWCV